MKYYFLFLSILIAQTVLGQDTPKKHTFSLILDIPSVLKIDKTYSRLPKRGMLSEIWLGYGYQKNKSLVEVQAHYFMGTLKTSSNKLNQVSPIGGGVFVKYLRELDFFASPQIKTYLGGRFVVRADLWFPKGNVYRYGWDLNTGLDISGRIRYALSPKLYLRYDTDLHLIGVLYRPHRNGQQLSTEKLQLEKGYLATAMENPYLATPLNSLYWNNRLGVHYRFSAAWHFFFAFQMDYLHLSPPLVKKGFVSHRMLGVSFNF